MNDPLSPPRALRALSAAATALWWVLVAFWLALALAWGALHGWIVPRIGELRPALETQATRVLGIPVRIGAISARSDSLMPSFELREVVLLDAQAREALRLSRVVVALSPRSLWNLGFEQLYIEGPSLDVRRLPDGRLQVAGLNVSGASEDTPSADWFFRQKEVLIQGGALTWTDEMRGAPPLALSDVQVVVRNGVRSHALRIDATPPADWGARFSLRGQFRQPLLSNHPGRWQDWNGQLFADFAAVDLSRLRQQVHLGVVDVRSGRGALRAWADVDHGRFVGGAADVAVVGVDATLAEGRPPLALASASGRLAGRNLPTGFEFETQGLQFEAADGRRWPGGNVSVAWRDAEGRQPAQGRLRADLLDLEALGRLAGHLPLGAATHAALAAHAPQGLVEQVQASWEGPLDALRKYQARGRVANLSVPAHAQTGRPGVRGAAVDFDFNEAGGKGRLQVERGAVDLPGVLEDPQVPVDQLAADLQWQLDGPRISFTASGLRVANRDLDASGQVGWRTGDTARGRFPGVLDLQLTLARADGSRVWRYLPLGVPKDTRDYVRDAVVAGQASDARFRVRGDLHDFPFKDAKTGEFRISAKVRDATYAYVPRANPRAPVQWAALTDLSGELVFERNGMQVKGAQGRFAGAPGLQVQAEARIPDFDTSVVDVNGTVKGPLAEQLTVFNATPVSAAIGQAFARTSATGPAELKLKLQLPVAQIDKSRVQGSVTLSNNDLQVAPGVPLLARARGTVSFTERGFALAGVQARALGGDMRLDGGTRNLAAPSSSSTEAPSVIRVQGTATAEGLRQARELGPVARLARHASGATPYAAVLSLRPQGVDVQVSSTLVGLGLSLPAPLAKAPEIALPLRLDILNQVSNGRTQDQVLVELGRLASITYVRDTSGPEPLVLRGAIGVGLTAGESAPLPEQGVAANLSFNALNADAWEQVLDATSTGGASLVPGRGSASTSAAQSYLPTQLAVRARELTAAGRTLTQVVVGGSRDGLTWRANIDATQLNGYLEYRQPSGNSAGRVMARLARLSLGAAATRDVEALLDEQPSSIPALDVVVDDFELRGKTLGRLEIDAVNRGASEWRLNKLALTMPEAAFTATGNWAATAAPATGPVASSRAARPPERRRTAMNFKLEVADAGQLLTRLGMKDVVRRGRGKLEGQVAWLGSPLALDYPSMNGAFTVNVESGQFLKAEPGLAKLLGVLSLQALPRRLTLDFRDVFSEGFAFDFVRGDIAIAQGIASTNNLQMKGVNAAVLMEGRADIARETQDLKVVVVPEINAGTASLVASVINPAVGLGTFLAQVFLREPLARATTQEFHIDGTWTDPRVTKVARTTP